MEKRISLLRSAHLDPDMLDEQARQMLNLAHRDEWVFFYDWTEAPSTPSP